MDVKTARPGGRSARIRRATLDAALACLDEGAAQLTIPEIAARAAVAPSSLYRRWGTCENLVAEALLDQSRLAIPVPDTGSIRDDLVEFSRSLAAYLTSRRGRAAVRAATALRRSDELDAARARFWDERLVLGAVMIDRAIDRGELDPDTDDRLLLEMVIAPLHLRASLFGTDPAPMIERQVDLLLDGLRRTS